MSLTSVFLVILMVSCYTVQTFFGKMFAVVYRGPKNLTTPVFAVLHGAVVTVVTYCYNGFRFAPSMSTAVLGIINGLVLTLFNLASVKVSQTGPYSFQSMMMLFGNTIVVFVVSTLVWRDQVAWVQTIGIVVMLMGGTVFNLRKEAENEIKKSYYFWIAVLFLTNGIYGVLMDCQQRMNESQLRNEMIIATFAASTMFSVFLLVKEKKHAKFQDMLPQRRAVVFLIGSSISAAAAVNLLMYVLRFVQSSVLFTVLNGGLMILSSVLSYIVLKEKLNRVQLTGIFLAVVGIVLTSI